MGLRESILRDGYGLAYAAVSPPLLDEVRCDVMRLIEFFYDGHTDNPDYWSYELDGQIQPVLYRIHNLEKQPGCPAVCQLLDDPALPDIASSCLGQRALATVRAAVIKLPRVGAPVPWHRDRSHDGVAAGQAVNLSLYLHDSTAGNGCLQVVPGSQTLQGDVDPDEWRRTHDITNVEARAGDITVHDVRLVHGSGPNRKDALCVRIVMEFRAESLPADVLLQR